MPAIAHALPRPRLLTRPAAVTTAAARSVGLLASLRCLVRGHDWWVDVDPFRDDDARCCTRCQRREQI